MIRKYIDSDLATVYDIWLAASTPAHPFLHDDFVEKVKVAMREIYLPGGETWVYEDQGRIVGFIGMMDHEIGGLFVYPKCHGQGIGTQLVNFIRQSREVLEVEVFEQNQIGRSFYDRYGFKQIKKYLHEPSGCEVLRLKFPQ